MTDNEPTIQTAGDAAPASPAPAPAASATPTSDPATSIAELQAQVTDLEDRWRRAVAEVENTRKRQARDLQQRLVDERARLAAAWLPVLDSLEMALVHAEADPSSIISGVQAVRDQALGILERLGYPRRHDEGARFDPARHEAVSAIFTDEARPGSVVHVLRPGYGPDERLLRPASVIVAAEVGDGEHS